MDAGYQADIDLGYTQITSLSSAQALTIPAGTKMVKVICETQAVRWRADGTNPTATVGYPLAVGAELTYNAGNFAALKFIEQAASAKLNVYFYG